MAVAGFLYNISTRERDTRSIMRALFIGKLLSFASDLYPAAISTCSAPSASQSTGSVSSVDARKCRFSLCFFFFFNLVSLEVLRVLLEVPSRWKFCNYDYFSFLCQILSHITGVMYVCT
mgnify:CR=1 FL=1